MQEAGIDVHQVSYSRYNESLVQKELDRWWGVIHSCPLVCCYYFAAGEEGISMQEISYIHKYIKEYS